MKTISLLFSFLLTILFGFLILLNFITISFNYQYLLLYAGVASIIYLILRVVGGSLDKKFNTSVQSFLDGKKKELFDDKGLIRTFGLLLITLLPFLFYLLLLVLFAAIDFALYGFSLISSLDRVPVFILIGLVAVPIGTGIAILVGFYYLLFPPKPKTIGITITENEQKKLWELTRKISTEIKAKPIDKIIITPETGIGVYLDGNVFSTIFGRGKRVLKIGLYSLHNLTIDELGGILAHEYGHFSNRDTSWSSYTYSMGNSLTGALRSMPGPSKGGGCGVRLIMSLNPAFWLLLLYVMLYFKITNGFSRIREVMADIMAMHMYGGRAFSNGLLKVAINDLVFSEIVQLGQIPKLLNEEKTITNFSQLMDVAFNGLAKKDIDELRNNLLFISQVHGNYDSHPALKIRIDYAKKFDDVAEMDKNPARELFDDWDDIGNKVDELDKSRLFYILRAYNAQPKAEEQKAEQK